MAINKKLIHFKTFANFNSLKLSANEANTKYTIGVSNTIYDGSPDILYHSICYIKDRKLLWTHGQLYCDTEEIREELNKIAERVDENEEVTSNAIFNLQEAIETNELITTEAISDIQENINILDSAIVEFSDNLETQNYIITDIFESVENLDKVVSASLEHINQVIKDNEESVTASILALNDKIPTKISLLDNDISYVTEKFVADKINNFDFKTINGNSILGTGNISVPTKFSDLENDQSLVNQYQLATINGQSLINDGQDIVIGGSSDVTVPTKTSDLTNDNGFVTSADNIASATKLQTTRYINGVGFDGTKDIYDYVVCGTSEATAAKTVTVNSDFKLQSGSKVTVKFNFPNTNTTPTLNVNSTGAKRMKYKGNYISNSFTFNSEALYTFIYDGSYWILEGDWDSYKKQDTLVSGTTIKTINGKSLLGSGDIAISGGNAEPMVCAYRVASYTANHIELDNYTYNEQTMNYREGAIILITNPFNADIVFEGGTLTLDGNEYEAGAFTLKTGATALFSLGVDPGVLFAISSVIESNSGGSSNANVQAVDIGEIVDGVEIEYATKTYVDDKVANISLTDYATIEYVDRLVGDINSVLESIINGGVSLITFTIDGTEYQAEEGMMWEDWVNSEYSADAFSIIGNMIVFKETGKFIAAQGAAEYLTTPIIAGYVYHLMHDN